MDKKEITIKSILIDTILITIIGFLVFLIIGRLFPQIKGTTTLLITLVGTYVLYFAVKYILFIK